MWWLLFCTYMAVMSRLAGSGFGQRWGVSWLPELLFSVPFGLSAAYALHLFAAPFWAVMLALVIGTAISYSGMQAATWLFLRWGSHDDPNTTRKATIKPVVDWIAKRFGYKLGDEGYAWVAAGVKGFIIGLPVGGLPLAILWPLGYEIGSHFEGRTERYGLDPHTAKELISGFGAGVAIVIGCTIIKWVYWGTV